ncbi:MAG: exopolysaccharide biosynthesis protein [Hyphomicrobiales bacterium]|nr:exopolysaccharide biosynthesis protein [Hyphomicrobiales bacterium]
MSPAPQPTLHTLAVERTSTIFSRLVRENTGPEVEVRNIVRGLKDRSFGMLMVMFAVPNAVIPGISFILGAPIILFALQIVWGRKTPWLPEFMLKRRLSQELFQAITRRVSKFLVWTERWLKPRWVWMSGRIGQAVLGVYLAFTAIVLMAPIPWGNALPAFSIAFISIGLIEKDGAAISIGVLLGLAGAAFVTIFGGGFIYLVLRFLGLA